MTTSSTIDGGTDVGAPDPGSAPASEAGATPEPRQAEAVTVEGERADSPEAADTAPAADSSEAADSAPPADTAPTPDAKPGKNSGRRRGPRPRRPHGARTPAPAPEPIAMPASDPSQWGRVDEEGAVWLRTDDGERQVGSYPGVPAEDALALFGRKYDELAGQVALLMQRISVGDAVPKDAPSTLEKLRASLDEAAVVGDLAALRAQLDEVAATLERRRAETEQARAEARKVTRELKERIVTEAEQLAESTSWKATGDRLRGLLEEWKAAPRLDRRADDELWKRFSGARSTFDKKRRAHFAALDVSRDEAKAVKTRIVKEAESLATSQEWGVTAGRYRQLLEEWKSSGRAAKGEEDALWQRFRAAQDTFFTARSATFDKRDAAERSNLEAKEALATEAERLVPVRDLKAAKSALRSLQERWEAVGHVPRSDKERVEGRMRRVEQAVRDAEQQQWQRTNPEARARAESATGQLRASIEKLEAQAAAARQAGNEKKAAEAEAAAAAKREWLAQAEKYVQ